MLNKFFILLYIVLQQNVLSIRLGCHRCQDLRRYSFVITSDTLPTNFLDKCSFYMSQQSCTIEITIDLDQQQTTLNVSASQEYVQTSINTVVSIKDGLKHIRKISFWCSDPRGGCNDYSYMKRVLQSISIDDKSKELEPFLMPTNETLNNTSCLSFSNDTTIKYSDKSTENTKACYISGVVDANATSKISASYSSMDNYYLRYVKTFLTESPTTSHLSLDDRSLLCAQPECNSIENYNRIGAVIKIDFDPSKFFEPTTTATIVPSTTPTGSGFTMWNNSLIVFLVMSFIYTVLLS
ncbi:unnamed protein product [Adineta ricciae]|uniref:Uncharacterized protein n=1 Tax=Adineta ricciae TaxID=249248 RepID=A0A815QGX6_ADIRI|nr:unnamed protein product [Adineta ricciae]CAF1462752.1 unnamed protein product [Adineta ricciae]